MKKFKSGFMLVLAAFIWGVAFSAQSEAMKTGIGAYSFNGLRFIIGGTVLLPVIFVINARKKAAGASRGEVNAAHRPGGFKKLLISGIICGIFLAIASNVQQIGLIYTSAGKAGFITALYVILVPIFGLFMGKRSTALLWFSAVLAVVGMYLLCLSESVSINRGDIFVFLSAVGYTFHILAIDKLAPDVDGVSLSCIQFFTSGVISLIIALFSGEVITASAIGDALIPLLYTGILSSGVAYTLQVVGQKEASSPVVASLLLSLESVFAALMAWVILGDRMSMREIFGGCIVFAAIILAQLPVSVKPNSTQKND